MCFDCKCIECDKHIRRIFDYRYMRENKIELYVIEDDGKYPAPTGYCFECVKNAGGNDLDLIVSKLDHGKISFVDFGRPAPDRILSATDTG